MTRYNFLVGPLGFEVYGVYCICEYQRRFKVSDGRTLSRQVRVNSWTCREWRVIVQILMNSSVPADTNRSYKAISDTVSPSPPSANDSALTFLCPGAGPSQTGRVELLVPLDTDSVGGYNAPKISEMAFEMKFERKFSGLCFGKLLLAKFCDGQICPNTGSRHACVLESVLKHSNVFLQSSCSSHP